jgi:hypothetical protein
LRARCPARASRTALTALWAERMRRMVFLSPPWGSGLAGSWTVFGADGGLRLSEVVGDLMPAAAPLERYDNPAGCLILAGLTARARPKARP